MFQLIFANMFRSAQSKKLVKDFSLKTRALTFVLQKQLSCCIALYRSTQIKTS